MTHQPTPTDGYGSCTKAKRGRLPIPIKIQPHVGAALAADLADETMLNVGQPDTIGPVIGADGNRMVAAVVGAIDRQPAHTAAAHLGEGEFGRVDGHGPSFR